jgi:hypothetical protein
MFLIFSLIEVTVVDGGGSMNYSNLNKLISKKETEVIERIILAHACAGIDISSDEYIEGINSTIEGLGNDL